MLWSAWVLLGAGCSNLGLEAYDTASVGAGAALDIVPADDIDFGKVATDATEQYERVVLTSVGDTPVAIIDIYLDPLSSNAFSVSDELPLPIRLEPGREFPVDVAFSPFAVGTFTGTLVIEVDDGGELVPLTRGVAGEGCTGANC